MRKTTMTRKEVHRQTYQCFKNGGIIRDPHVSLYWLTPLHTVKMLKEGKPRVRFVHCPSDEFTFCPEFKVSDRGGE